MARSRTNLITTVMPNLIGGVSQQPDTVKYSNQCAEQLNATPSVSEGLKKRTPTEHLATLKDFEGTPVVPTNDGGYATHVHTINRDVDERYVVSVVQELNPHGFDDNMYRAVVRVNDVNGVAQDVKYDWDHLIGDDLLHRAEWVTSYLSPLSWDPNDSTYNPPRIQLENTDEGTPDLAFQTVGDVTLILNKKVKPQQSLHTPTTDQGQDFFEGLATAESGGGPRLEEGTLGFFTVKLSDYGKTFRVILTSRKKNEETGRPDWSAKFEITTRNPETLQIGSPDSGFVTTSTPYGPLNTMNAAAMLCQMINGHWGQADEVPDQIESPSYDFSAEPAGTLPTTEGFDPTKVTHYDSLGKWTRWSGVVGGEISTAFSKCSTFGCLPGLVAKRIGSTVFLYRNQSWVDNGTGEISVFPGNPFTGALGTHKYPDIATQSAALFSVLVAI